MKDEILDQMYGFLDNINYYYYQEYLSRNKKAQDDTHEQVSSQEESSKEEEEDEWFDCLLTSINFDGDFLQLFEVLIDEHMPTMV